MRRSRWIVLVAVVGCLVAWTLCVVFLYQPARMEGTSMAPTLESQDRVLVNKWIYLVSSPKRGDVVMLRYPLDPTKAFVKRVIARGGDTLRIEDGRVYVNGEPIRDEAYVPDDFRDHSDLSEHTIKVGHYFVLGDHRNNSADSRHWGQVPDEYMMGRISVRWWPTPGGID